MTTTSFQAGKTHKKFVNCLELGFQTLRVDIECILVVLVELYSRLEDVFEAVTRHSKAPCRVVARVCSVLGGGRNLKSLLSRACAIGAECFNSNHGKRLSETNR